MAAERCPVCGGNGQVPNGFYLQTGGQWTTSSTTPEKCRTCKGEGVVFSPPSLLSDSTSREEQ